jgi:ribonuclease D
MRSIIIQYRLKRGKLPTYSHKELTLKIELLYDFLADENIAKIFHNGASFDITVLEEIGFTVNNYIFDTMIAWHTAWPETPKRLEFVAGVFGIPKWKHLAQDDDDESK